MATESIPNPDPERLDLDAVVRTLRSGKATTEWLGTFLPATYAAPTRFRRALYAFVGRNLGTLKSVPDKAYDIYHDTIAIHTGRSRRAFVVASERGDAEITFDNLHQRAAKLALAWAHLGLEPGKVVAIVLPLHIDALVAIAACLRVGAVIALVSPDGPSFVRNRLERLAPDFLVTNDKFATWCEAFADKRLAFALPVISDTTPPSHSYQPDEPVFRVLSAFGEADAEPMDVDAASVHEGLLVSGFVALTLERSDVLAAPGFSHAQFQPLLLLSALAAGAAFAEISPRDVITDATVLERVGVTVLGVCRRVRDGLLAKGDSSLPGVSKFPKGLRLCFRSLTEAFDLERWFAFQNLAWERKVPASNIAASNAAPFVHLFSPPAQPSPGALRVWPVPGRTFAFTEVAAGELPALRSGGIYTPLVKDKPADPPGLPAMMLARDTGGYTFAGCVNLGHDAQTYPTDEVARIVETHKAVRHAVVVLSSANHANDAVVVLIAFTEDSYDKQGRVVPRVLPDDLRALVERELGPTLAPDRIEIFPLRPRIVDGVVDVARCRDQYMSGLLHQKADSELYLLLSRLGYILAGPASSSTTSRGENGLAEAPTSS